jgi:mannose-6-phosphate isomerase-like protein (cupin superfamily)
VDKFNLAEEFVVLTPDKVAGTVTNTPAVFEELDRLYGDFKNHELIALFEFQQDWPSWEIHPNGDEVVVLLAGSATFVLRLEDGKREIVLRGPGDSVIVPRGVWHTARIDTPTRMLFITPGEGTLNEYDKTRFD